MKKNRVIPFGYCMKNREITTKPKEVYAVATIFNEYLSVSSLLQIAKLMESEKIRYIEDSEHWNKKIIKRIIENEKYLGNDKYPQIIDEDIFKRVLSYCRCDLQTKRDKSAEAVNGVHIKIRLKRMRKCPQRQM
ncbi:MAG: recombinase family protein [Ruminococcus sp.]|nr:recombinase family protein [Ruminococcus sp.]